MIKIKIISKEEWIKDFNRPRVYQLIDGDLVDGITDSNRVYIPWLGYKTINYETL